MASVDGARPTDKPSDTVSNVKCDPCVHSGLEKEARAYCQQCEEHMCVECASMHKGFKQSRTHSIIFGSDLLLAEQTGVKKLSLSYCAEHGDKAIEWFCEKDDVMFCDTCKHIKHRKCQVTSVSDKNAFGHAKSLADVMDSLVSLNLRITKLKAERQNSTQYLEDVGYSCQLAVQQFKSTIIETVERLEKELLSDITKIITTETAIIQDHVFTCDSLIPQVVNALTTADEAKTAPDNMIASHKLAKALKTFEPIVTDLEQEAYNVQIKFKPSGKLADLFKGTYQLGILEVDRTETVGVDLPDSASEGVPPVSVRTLWTDLEVVSSIEVKVPSNNVSGSAVLPDGRLILCDRSNKKTILLGHDFTIQSTLMLPCMPRDVALYGDNAAVVTLPGIKLLQYIHVDTTLRAGHTIPIGLMCSGVALHGGEIYVTVKGGQYGDHVQVLDTDGNMTRRIGVDVHGQGRRSVYPNYITVDTGGTVYTSHYGSDHITCYTKAGDMVYDVNHEDMSGPQGMSVDDDGNLLVCCYKSHTIHVLGKDGAQHKVLLSTSDGVVCPISVSYRRRDHTLIVTMNTSCRAYKLK